MKNFISGLRLGFNFKIFLWSHLGLHIGCFFLSFLTLDLLNPCRSLAPLSSPHRLDQYLSQTLSSLCPFPSRVKFYKPLSFSGSSFSHCEVFLFVPSPPTSLWPLCPGSNPGYPLLFSIFLLHLQDDQIQSIFLPSFLLCFLSFFSI